MRAITDRSSRRENPFEERRLFPALDILIGVVFMRFLTIDGYFSGDELAVDGEKSLFLSVDEDVDIGVTESVLELACSVKFFWAKAVEGDFFGV